jgi:16S rRNA (adenine1518-N6/adenine1519-N6)-dimethyltransferase
MKLIDLKARMQEMEVRAKKALGQNFLVSESVISRILERVHAVKPPMIVEVGPGLGSLTEGMLEFEPTLVELDTVFAEYWRERGLQVVEGDAIQINWNDLPLKENSWLVSNLPYQIASILVVDRSVGPQKITGMVLMFQKEVAQRLMGKPRTSEYGFISVIAQNFWEMKKVVDAAPKDFHPSPKVSSRVLEFRRKTVSGLDAGFVGFIKAAFKQRRKFLLKNLKAVGNKDWAALLNELSINEKARAEELTPEQFAELYRRWKKK